MFNNIKFKLIQEGKGTPIFVRREIGIHTATINTIELDDLNEITDIKLIESLGDYIIEYCIQNNKNKICFGIINDAFMFNRLVIIDKIIKHLVKVHDYKIKNIFLLFGVMPDIININYYTKACKEFNWLEVNTVFVNSWEKYIRLSTNNNLEFYDNFNNEIKIKSKKFTCYNRNIKPHRIMLCAEMIKRNLLDQAYYSMYLPKDDNNGLYRHKFAKCGYLPDYLPKLHQSVIDTYEKNSHLFPLSLGLQGVDWDSDRMLTIMDQDRPHWEDAYFMVVTETKFFHDAPHNLTQLKNELTLECILISEKTFKCIQGKMPFILTGFPRSLECLRRFGYKTFHPYINESYDIIENDEDRLLAIADEIERLCHFSDEQFLDWQKDVRPIVEHNYNLLKKPRELILKNFAQND